jgi:F-type H+-transporting ATPase subunit O
MTTDARYATSLYTAAVKQNALSAVEKDVAEVRKLMESVPKFKTYLMNPIVKRTEKKADLDKISKGMNPVTRGFLALLAENGRLAELDKIVGTFGKLMDAERGVVTATVTSADELSDDQLKTVEAQIKSSFIKPGQTIRLETSVDPDILGGLQVQVGDKFLDLSVASQINQISKVLGAN